MLAPNINTFIFTIIDQTTHTQIQEQLSFHHKNLSQIIKPKSKFHFYRFMNSKIKPQNLIEILPQIHLNRTREKEQRRRKFTYRHLTVKRGLASTIIIGAVVARRWREKEKWRVAEWRREHRSTRKKGEWWWWWEEWRREESEVNWRGELKIIVKGVGSEEKDGESDEDDG